MLGFLSGSADLECFVRKAALIPEKYHVLQAELSATS
jgi:hypothetical protein